MAGIVYSDYYMPESCRDAIEILKYSSRQEVKDEEFCDYFISQSRLKNICIEKELNEVEIFDRLIDKFFISKDIKPEEISHIIYITFPGELIKKEICTPYLLQTKYNLSTATVMTMYQDCATVIQSIQIAEALIDSGNAKNIMILSICQEHKIENRFIGTTIVGDGAGIMVVGSRDFECEILKIKSVANGRFSYNLYNHINEEIWTMDLLKRGAGLILELLKESNIDISAVQSIIMQNLNHSGYYAYSKFLNVSLNKLYLQNIPNGGHLAAADTIRNYSDVLREDKVCKDGYFLLYAAGTVGAGMDFTINAALLRKR